MPKLESAHIYYKEGYKYQLTQDAWFKTNIIGYLAHTKFLELSLDGWLLVRSGYAWDGPSGPTIDTLDSMRASLPHDGSYQLMRLGLISNSCREIVDKELRERLLTDGMDEIRANAWYGGVHLFAGNAADPENKKKEIKAP